MAQTMTPVTFLQWPQADLRFLGAGETSSSQVPAFLAAVIHLLLVLSITPVCWQTDLILFPDFLK